MCQGKVRLYMYHLIIDAKDTYVIFFLFMSKFFSFIHQTNKTFEYSY